VNVAARLHEHAYFGREPIVARAPLRWPGGRPLALAVVVSVEYYEMRPPEGAFIPPNVPGSFGRGPYPDFRAYSTREYGNRVGIFRIVDALSHHGVVATAAVDAYTARHRPRIVRACRERGWEIAAHGQALTQALSSAMVEADERRYIGDALDALAQCIGNRPKGWHGPEYGESARTPALLAEHGVEYVLDWPNDEQPYAMTTPAGALVSVPMAIDLDDVFAHWHRKLSMRRWTQAVSDAVDRLAADGCASGRLLVLNLHPWLTGQPHRITYLNELLAQLKLRDDIWWTTAGEVSAWFSQRR
jgi:allantoinase